MIIIRSSMIRMTWIRVEGVGFSVPSFLSSFLPSFLASFVSPSFLPSLLPLFLPSFLSPGIPSFLPCGVLISFLLIFLPSFLASFFSPSFLPSFLSLSIHSFLPSFIAFEWTPPAKKKKKRTEKIHPPRESSMPVTHPRRADFSGLFSAKDIELEAAARRQVIAYTRVLKKHRPAAATSLQAYSRLREARCSVATAVLARSYSANALRTPTAILHTKFVDLNVKLQVGS